MYGKVCAWKNVLFIYQLRKQPMLYQYLAVSLPLLFDTKWLAASMGKNWYFAIDSTQFKMIMCAALNNDMLTQHNQEIARKSPEGYPQ